MDYRKMLDVLIKKLGREEIGRIIIGEICPATFGLATLEECATYPQNCRKCWAEALGLEEEEVEKS
jgi:hypothetical protein